MHAPVYKPKDDKMSHLYIDQKGLLHSDTWYIIDGVAGIERDHIVFNIYFLTYCI